MTGTPQSIHTPQAPAALGPYSQAVATDGLVFVSGQLGIDPATGELAAGAAPEQAHQALTNIAAILEAAGTSLANVVKTTVLLADIADFAPVNEVYGPFFEGGVQPARAAFQVAALPKGALVEIEAVATR